MPKKAHLKSVCNHKKHHPPKPPSRFLWLMEAVLISLAIFAVLSVIVILWLAITNHKRAQDAVRAITGITPTQKASSEYKKIHSNLGIELTINDSLQEAEATLNNGKVVTGKSLYEPNNYSQISIYIRNSAKDGLEGIAGIDRTTYMTVLTDFSDDFFSKARQQHGQNLTEMDLVKMHFAPIADPNKAYVQQSLEDVTMEGNRFVKIIWEITNNQPIKYKTRQIDYLTIQHGRPYKVTIYQNAGYDAKDLPPFTEIVNSLKFYPPEKINKITNSRNGHNRLLPGKEAQATSQPFTSDSTLQVVAKNMPSVVRVATTYCIDFQLTLGEVVQAINGGCGGGTGSGFIINPEGIVATNGHVVKFTPSDVLIDSIYLGNKQVTRSYLDFLVKSAQTTQAVANQYYTASVGGNRQAQDEIVGSITLLPEAAKTQVINEEAVYAVQLSNESVRFNANNLREFNFNSNIVFAKLVDIDYNPYDDITNEGFSSSDVALLKLQQSSEYPFASLGSIDSLSSGSMIVVIGFPGLAENQLVNTTESVPTSTEGKVNSIRTAKGTNNKLIQSDVTISRGNSGGPAFNSNGEVVGLATYGLEESGNKLNYMRDIADLKSLIKKNNINLPESAVGAQKEWEVGLLKYSKAYYSSAINSFKRSQSMYPQNRIAADFIAKAESYQKDGKEATPPEVYQLIVISSLVLIIIPAITLFFVVRHHRKRKRLHEDYHQQNKFAPPAQALASQSTSLDANDNLSKRDMLSNATSFVGSNDRDIQKKP